MKGKGKASTNTAIFSLVSQSQTDHQCRIDERFDVQQREIKTLKALIAQMTIS